MATSKAIEQKKPTPVALLKVTLDAVDTKKHFENVLQKEAGAFMASILDLFQNDQALQQCDPNSVIRECMKAASLKLPINKNLGFAYIIAYKSNNKFIPQFQMGYKGYIQLAMRTGQFKYLNAGIIHEGMKVINNLITGEVRIEGEAKSANAIGYFAYMELINGFRKTIYISKEDVIAHAKRFSKSFNSANSPWKTDFDPMALKTAILKLSKYFPMTVEMAKIIDESDEDEFNTQMGNEANQTIIEATGQQVDGATGEIKGDPPADDGKSDGKSEPQTESKDAEQKALPDW